MSKKMMNQGSVSIDRPVGNRLGNRLEYYIWLATKGYMIDRIRAFFMAIAVTLDKRFPNFCPWIFRVNPRELSHEPDYQYVNTKESGGPLEAFKALRRSKPRLGCTHQLSPRDAVIRSVLFVAVVIWIVSLDMMPNHVVESEVLSWVFLIVEVVLGLVIACASVSISSITIGSISNVIHGKLVQAANARYDAEVALWQADMKYAFMSLIQAVHRPKADKVGIMSALYAYQYEATNEEFVRGLLGESVTDEMLNRKPTKALRNYRRLLWLLSEHQALIAAKEQIVAGKREKLEYADRAKRAASQELRVEQNDLDRLRGGVTIAEEVDASYY